MHMRGMSPESQCITHDAEATPASAKSCVEARDSQGLLGSRVCVYNTAPPGLHTGPNALVMTSAVREKN